MTLQKLIEFLENDMVRRFGPVVGRCAAAAALSAFRRFTEIKFNDEQSQSLIENEIKAMAHRADDERRALGLAPNDPEPPLSGAARVVGMLLAALLLTASTAAAQGVTEYEFKVCPRGAACGTPVMAHTFPATAATCGQAKVMPTGVVPNPRYVRFDDPADSTRDCVIDTGASAGPLFALPFSPSVVYDATVQAVNTAGVSPESARSNPFNRPGAPPAARTGVRVTGS